jgi:hypothetical protein
MLTAPMARFPFPEPIKIGNAMIDLYGFAAWPV